MKIFKRIAVATCLIVSSNAFAGEISDYSLNAAKKIITDSGNKVEWLQWEVTRGFSVNEALETYSKDGWQLASNEQMAELFNTFDFSYGLFSWTNGREYSAPIDGDLVGRERTFASLFGNTYTDSALPNLAHSAAFFGQASFNQHSRAYVVDGYNLGNGLSKGAAIGNPAWHRDFKSPSTGIALVRNISVNANVPEPTSIAMLSIALLGLSARRFSRS